MPPVVIVVVVVAQNDPARYMGCMKALVEYYRRELAPSHLPLVVNTQGWIRGLGLEMLHATIHYLLPDHVVQVASPVLRSRAHTAGASSSRVCVAVAHHRFKASHEPKPSTLRCQRPRGAWR